MPYHLEKGPLQRILEEYLNAPRAKLEARVQKLKASVGSPQWLIDGVFKNLKHDKLSKSPLGSAAGLYKHLMEHWFGFVETSPGSGNWVRQDNLRPGYVDLTTGYWVAYRGNVAEIMRQGLLLAMEMALVPPPSASATGTLPPPHRIELYWKCASPWFELWLLRRPYDLASSDEAVITVLMSTPAQFGAMVAASPLAVGPSTQTGSGPAVPSWEDDYECIGRSPFPPGFAPPPGATPPRPAPTPAALREHAMWVVSHENHVPVGPGFPKYTNPNQYPMWVVPIPQGAIYEGVGAVVTVSPSQPAGGVKFDGSV